MARRLPCKSLSDRDVIVAVPGDDQVPALIALINALAAERSQLFIQPVDPVGGLAAVRTHLAAMARGHEMVLVARHDEALVGLITGSRGSHPARRGVVDIGIGVRADRRGRGVGFALMSALEDHALRAGCHRLQLHVATTNAAAIALYRKIGFVVEGELRGTAIIDGRRVDEFAMAKLLTPKS